MILSERKFEHRHNNAKQIFVIKTFHGFDETGSNPLA
jgi:hypothetical protein